jgi:P pilus assembly chaperone PapD
MREKLWVCLVVLLLFTGLSVFPSPAVAAISAHPASVNLGSVNVNSSGSPVVISLYNNNDHSTPIDKIVSSSSEFVVISPALPLILPALATTSFQIVFKPTTASTVTGSITLTMGTRSISTLVVSVSGTGAALPVATHLLSSNASALSFGNISVGSSGSQSATISNTGNSSVTISAITLAGTGFKDSSVSLPATLAAGQTLSLPIVFAPAICGASSGSATIVSNATNSPITISLSATGVQPLITVVPTSVSFGSVTVGVTNTQTITVKNPGTANLTITQASLSGSGFADSGISLPVTVAPGASSSFTLSFDPTTASATTGALTLASNAPTSSLSVALSGTGIAQTRVLASSSTSLSFGSLTLQTSASQAVTLTNTGNSSVTISQLTVAGAGFSYSGLTFPVTLAAGQSASFNAIFDPTTPGSMSGSVTVVSNASNSPQTIALSGTGAAPVTYSVSLSWQASTSSVVGYNIYGASQSGGPYTRVNASPVASTSYSDASVVAGSTYYFVTTAVDSSGDESGYSNQVTAVIP